jgi:hypothetical protein
MRRAVLAIGMGAEETCLDKQVAEALRRVTHDEWAVMIKVLTLYAKNRSRRLGWRTENTDELPGGETAASIVSKAIVMVYRGALEEQPDEGQGVKAGLRRWDPVKDPSLKKYLMDVIKSILNHLAEGDENRIFRRVPVDERSRDWEGELTRPTADREWLARGAETPEEILLRKEETALRIQALDVLQDEVSDDDILYRVVISMRAGKRGPADISEDTGIPAKQVYNAAKRLDRKGAAVRMKLRQTGATPDVEEKQ